MIYYFYMHKFADLQEIEFDGVKKSKENRFALGIGAKDLAVAPAEREQTRTRNKSNRSVCMRPNLH